jgi:hypothetical protein
MLAALLASVAGYTAAQDRQRDASRGELLYSIHCTSPK